MLTANDYLARRDALWMRGIYEWFGLSAGHVSQNMTAEERRAAYLCDVTYATANEVGFDFLRDGLARSAEELVQRPFAFAVIDEADSILIDEARIPLVIAGGLPEDSAFAYRVDSVVAGLRPHAHYSLDEFARNVQLTDAGIRRVEAALGCGSLFDEHNLQRPDGGAGRAACARAAAARRGLRGETWLDRNGGRVQRPHRAESPLAGGTAIRRGSQGARAS